MSQASPEAEGRRGDQVMAVKRQRQRCSSAERREEVWGEVRCGMGCSRGPFIGPGKGCQGVGVTAGDVVASIFE
jgi:hypothetical protein